MPGVSTTQPPKSSLISSAVVVVCLPFWLTSLTSRTRRPRPGLDRVQQRRLADAALPGEDGLAVRAARSRRRSMPLAGFALVRMVGTPSWLYMPMSGW